jgi:glycosyltransferase involved in cell wall biosynthesis
MIPQCIHLWAPGIRAGSGGIQSFSRDLALALHAAFPQSRLHLQVKNDSAADDLPEGIGFSGSGRWPGHLRTAHYALTGVQRLRREKPDLVIATLVNFLPAIAVARPACTVAVAHGIDVWDLPDGPRRRALSQVERVVAVSHFTRDRVAALPGLDPARLRVVPNSFAENAFQPGPKPLAMLQRYGLRADQPVLLTVSRLDPAERYKGHAEVLAALPALAQEFPGLRYLIAGQGGLAEELQQQARALGVAEWVIFAGFVPEFELADHYRLADAFVMPSRGEGFGIVFLEAMACGRPVIAGNADGSVDALNDGRLGVLVDPGNPAELVQAVRDVLTARHPNRLLFDPQRLHDEVVAAFGAGAFRTRWQRLVEEL